MESGARWNSIKKLLEGQVLDSSKFGRGNDQMIWVKSGELADALAELQGYSECPFDWLEGLTAMHVDQSIALTVFLRSTTTSETLIVRCSVEIKKSDQRPALPSIAGVFPSALIQEGEISELFGVQFTRKDGSESLDAAARLLPPSWEGFPLRKDYAFPREVLGVSHVRKEARK